MQEIKYIDNLIMQLAQSTNGIYIAFGCVLCLILFFIVAGMIKSFRG